MSSAGARTSDRRLFGILCTYRRPEQALRYLDALEQQTTVPELVLVLDNSSDASLATAISARGRRSLNCEYIDPGTNVGPAGAFRLGFERLRQSASPDDFVALFDDDDPPVSESQLAKLLDNLIRAQERDPSICGIGLSGGVLNRWTGTVKGSDRSACLAEVDHLHGGYLPIYTMEGLLAVESFDPSFFYGFEELELGRRLHAAGRKLIVDNRMMATLEPLYGKKARQPKSVAENYAADNGWSRFHKERNLIRILRREHLWTAITFTVVTRYVMRPLLAMTQSRHAGRDRLVIGLRAARAGLSNRRGIDARYPPP